MREIVDIYAVLKDFYTVSGMKISLYDTEFNQIYSYPEEVTEFCKCLQEDRYILADCRKNDKDAFARVKSTGDVYVYKCRRGLYEAVAPLYNFGTLSGYLIIGQVCDTSDSSMDYVIKKATEILGDRSRAESLAAKVKTVDIKNIDAYISLMTIIAEYLTSTNKVFLHSEKLPKLVKEYINKNYPSKITLTILSQKFGCCNSTLTNSFKKEYKITIMEYLFEVRLQKARDMIVKTRRSFKEISSDCGFYDQNYFSKSFTKKYGCSPSEYRDKNTA